VQIPASVRHNNRKAGQRSIGHINAELLEIHNVPLRTQRIAQNFFIPGRRVVPGVVVGERWLICRREIGNIHVAAGVEVILRVNFPRNRLVIHQAKNVFVRDGIFGDCRFATALHEAIIPVAIEVVTSGGKAASRSVRA
jgi:hypothetical protein